MENKKTDESVKAGLQIAADTNPAADEQQEVVPVTEGEQDIDEVVHDHTTQGNIENVEGEPGSEKDVDDLLHKLPGTTSTNTNENNEQDIDDLMHRK